MRGVELCVNERFGGRFCFSFINYHLISFSQAQILILHPRLIRVPPLRLPPLLPLFHFLSPLPLHCQLLLRPKRRFMILSMKFTVENIVELNITQNFESLLFRTVDEYCTILFELRSGPEIDVQHGPSTTFHTRLPTRQRLAQKAGPCYKVIGKGPGDRYSNAGRHQCSNWRTINFRIGRMVVSGRGMMEVI